LTQASEDTSVPVLVTFDRRTERLLTVIDVGRVGLRDPGLEARKAWVPVTVQAVTRELSDKLGLAGQTGVRVTRVLAPAGSAFGLQMGDIVTAIDGNPIQSTQPSDAELFA